MRREMNNKGFSLITVLILSLVMFLIGGTGLYIAATNFRATRADINYNIAEKAANAGLMAAYDFINMHGSAGTTDVINDNGKWGNVSFSTKISLGGQNVWFLNSQGKLGTLLKTKVTKTAMFQGYYGVGLYTVRGKVKASIAGTRLSGCDNTSTPNCFVPAFIASGEIDTTKTTAQSCFDSDGKIVGAAVDGSTAGLYGAPAEIIMNQGDLSKIFFRVKCFNRNGNSLCTPSTSLLDYLEYDYGRNTAEGNHYDFSFQQADNPYGIPVVSFPASFNTSPSGSCTFPESATPITGTAVLDLASPPCNVVVLNNAQTNITIKGVRSGTTPVTIYTDGSSNTPTFSNASNFIFYSRSQSQEFTVENSSNFKIYSSTDGKFKTTNNNFTLYTTGITYLDGTYSSTIDQFRIISRNKISANVNAILTNGTLITGPASVNDINSPNAPQNLLTNGNLIIDNVNLFARKMLFTDNSTVDIWNSLVYVYASACPTCSRTAATGSASSTGKCLSDPRWCGFSGEEVQLNIGKKGTATAAPVLFLSNNTSVYVTIANPNKTYLWGVFYGEDVTYLNTSSYELRGFYIRNFPEKTDNDAALQIDLDSDKYSYSFHFSRAIIDAISAKYRFFRQVECVRDPLTPKTQLIQTRMTNY